MNFPTQTKIALRNVIKNRRRSGVTIASIAIGFLALSLFEGYFTYTYGALEDQAIIGERLGHLTVAKRGYYDQSGADPQEFLFTAEELARIETILDGDEAVALVSPRLSISGLVSNGQVSRIFLGEGVPPADIAVLRGEKYAHLPGQLDETRPDAAVFGSRLADLLGLRADDSAVLLGSSAHSMVNAVDVVVLKAANTGSTATDDKSIVMPLELAQRLYDIDGADRISILLTDKALIPDRKAAYVQQLTAAGFDVEVRDWQELSVYYGQVRSLFDIMYLFISVVVLVVVVASVMNIMGMAITERTREIGTMRAIGMRIGTLRSMFVLEAVLIVTAGCLIGIAATYGIGGMINAAGITYTPPDASAEAELVIEIVGANLVGSLFTLAVMSGLACLLSARRATAKPIVEALAHV